jgi:RecB family exonuclease
MTADLLADLMPAPRDAPGWASYSSVTQHNQCPQRWMYDRIYGLEAIPRADDARVELNFGIWWQALRAADSIERGRKLGTLLEEPKRLSLPDGEDDFVVAAHNQFLPEQVLADAVDWWSRQPEEHKALWDQKLGDSLVSRLRALDLRWHERWDAELENEEPLLVEAKWVRRIPGAEVELLGYIDEVYRDRRRNLVVVRDNKTGKDSPANRRTVDDMMDSQTHLYAWGIGPVLEPHGLKVNAVAYDRVRSVRATTPKLTQTGTLSKTVTQFDLRTYCEWAAAGQEYSGRKKDGSDGGIYELDPVVVEHLSSPGQLEQWMVRTISPLNRHLVRAHLQASLDALKDMDVSYARITKRGEARRVLGDHCKWCDFAGLCRAQMTGGPDGTYPLGDFGLRVRARR